ncbi:MAG: class I SAM-dependent methyltransferase [Propionivibrio sp.]|nr:class I SAM-dependent methyltransferase [Propionivibrio sp.]
MTGMLSRFTNDPLGFLGRVFTKLFIAPVKYRSRMGYDARRYWHDRFEKYGLSLKGVGDEGLSEEENRKMYQEAAESFLALCRRECIDFTRARVLEIGCGNGFYTKLLAQQKVGRYLGLDITNIFFHDLETEYPDFKYICRDIASGNFDGEFDLILMIDVIEHITH